jgi:hypothetical protein
MQEMVANISPLQALLVVAFQVWIIAAPIVIIRKLDRLSRLLEERSSGPDEEETQ